MIVERPSTPVPESAKACGTMGPSPVLTPTSGRPGQGGFAPESFSALVIVLIVGAVGLLILAAGRRFGDIVRSQACQPRNPAGPEALRS